MDTFEVGEVAIFWNAARVSHGREVTVTSLPQPEAWIDFDGLIVPSGSYGIEMDGDLYHAPPHMLRKRRPPQELGSWDRCVWQPKQLVQ